MGTPAEKQAPGPLRRLQDAAEEWIYRANERNHWVFRVYDAWNEVWASLVFRGLRRRARRVDAPIAGREIEARIRLLTPADDDAFAALLARFDFTYLPPHAIDRAGAESALRRRSYLPFGIFRDGRLDGYLLVRLFFPWRGVTGIWVLPTLRDRGLSQAALRTTAAFTRSERLPDFATIGVNNPGSVRMAVAAGWDVIRTNRRFHVLKRR